MRLEEHVAWVRHRGDMGRCRGDVGRYKGRYRDGVSQEHVARMHTANLHPLP